MKKVAANFFIFLGVAGFAFGLFELFKLRFEAGDVYPAYSSLRADPLGTMALFESLGRMPGLTLRRDFGSANQLPDGSGSTYLHLAARKEEWKWLPEEAAQEVQRYVAGGGRLVISFLAETSPAFTRTNPPVRSGKPPPGPPKGPGKNVSGLTLFEDRWGVEFGFKALPVREGETYGSILVVNRTELPLPTELEWHSGMFFTNVNAAWKTAYARGTNPVVLERKFGTGSVVLMTDCYCLSNEAMVADRHPDLLTWLIGSSKTIDFDEAHLGLMESPGVSALMRQYRLHGLIAGLLLVAALFIWKNSVSFVPRLKDNPVGVEIMGKEASAGLVNLLRRNIPPREVLRACFSEWTKSLSKRSIYSLARVDEAQAVFEAEARRAKPDQDSVRVYREIRQALKNQRLRKDQEPK